MFLPEAISATPNLVRSRDIEEYKIARYLEELDLAAVPPQDQFSEDLDLPVPATDEITADTDENDSIEPPEPVSYQTTVLCSPAYRWLITSLRTELNLSRENSARHAPNSLLDLSHVALLT